MTAPTLEAERAAPCPLCGGTATPMHTDDCYFVMQQKLRDAPKGDLSLVPEVLAAWNRRTAAPVAEDVALPPLDAEGLPELPKPVRMSADQAYLGYTAEQVRQAQREAYELGKRASIDGQLTGAPSPVKHSIDTPEFRRLLHAMGATTGIPYHYNQLIAYIDGRTAGTAPTDPFAAQRFLNWNRCQEKPPVAIGKELGVARKVMEFAAAPSPLPPQEEEKS